MTRLTKIEVTFVVAHILLVTGALVAWAYDLYPTERSGKWPRLSLLEEIHNEVEQYREREGSYPDSLDSFLHLDSDTQSVYFGEKPLKRRLYYYPPDPNDEVYCINKTIRYQLVEGKPVLTDLGNDQRDGGIKMGMDIFYPSEYQTKFPFGEFLRTVYFWKAFLLGLIYSVAMSLCLYGIWRRNSPAGEITLGVVFKSVLFLAFELAVATVIMGMHVYPHH